MKKTPRPQDLQTCKYVEICSYDLPTDCYYRRMQRPCPPDSGTDNKCNGKCIQYTVKSYEEV